LDSEAAIVAFEGRPLVIFESGPLLHDLLRVLTRRDVDSQSLKNVLDTLSDDQDRDQWTTWLSTYRAPDELAERATAVIEMVEAIDSSNRAEVAAVRRIDRFSYPLSVAGMVLAVLASGHLLKSIPSRDPQLAAGQTPQLTRFVLTSAALVFSLSALDLIWTILAAQAGQIRELNPLGQGLIEDPASLVAFKLSATLISCALLVALRRHHSAQIASWWLCLVCTMLTFRWLMFNSMFMGT
jgi:hypothetical protein